MEEQILPYKRGNVWTFCQLLLLRMYGITQTPEGKTKQMEDMKIMKRYKVYVYNEERGIDGYIELVQLPNELDDLNEDDAAEWFRANRYYEFYPTAYDCSGQRFTNWYKLHRRCGHWFAYHSVSFDV